MKSAKFVTLAEVAQELGASRATVRAWLAEGGVAAYAFGTGQNSTLRYLREEVDDWIDEQEEAEAVNPADGDEGDEEADEADDDDDQEDEGLDDDEELDE